MSPLAAGKKQSVLNGAMILMTAVVLVKIIGVLFKMPLTDMLGAVGRGYFNSAYEIYTPIFAISMAGLPIAVSRMVAESVALDRCRQARAVFSVAKKIFLLAGILGTLLMLIAAYPYARFSAGTKSLPAIFAVAPSIFFCCYMSAYRGYYEGLQNMTPTAVSQVIEAAGKLVIGLVLAKSILSAGIGQYESGMAASSNTSATVFGKAVTNLTEANSVIRPWAAAGAVIGVTLGSVLSLVFLIVYHRVKGDGFDRVRLVNSPKPERGETIAREMIRIAIPMVVSALILNITNLIDTVTIQARLTTALEKDFNAVVQMHAASINAAVNLARLNISDHLEVMKYLWGAYGTALDFKSLVPTITIQLGVSALPALAAAWTVKNRQEVKTTIETVLRVGMLIALPAGIGMASLATPILTILYGRGESSEAIPVIAPIMAAYGFATFAIALSTPIMSMLQAIGRTDIPMKSVAVAAVIKILCNFILVGNPKYNVYGAVAGTILFYVIIVVSNLVMLLLLTGARINWLSVFLKPLACAALCGVTAFAFNGLLVRIFKPDTTQSILNMGTFSVFIAVLVAVVVYVLSLLLLRGILKEDVSVLPKGEKITKTLEKYGLLG